MEKVITRTMNYYSTLCIKKKKKKESSLLIQRRALNHNVFRK